MDHVSIVKRAFQITFRYRALWLFGFILALCGGGGGGGGTGGNPGFTFGDGGRGEFPELDLPGRLPTPDPALLIGIGLFVVCLILVLSLVAVAIQAITRTSLIRMVQQIEDTAAVTTTEGWRYGWSRRALRIFLIGLVIAIPLAIAVIIMIGVGLSPLLLLAADSVPLKVLGGVGAAVLLLIFILIMILLSIVLTPLRELAWREAALDGRDVLESIRQSYALIRSRLKDVGIMWLILFGIGLGWGIVNFILAFVLVVFGVVAGGIPAAVAYLLTDSPIAAAVAGVPLGLIVVVIPLTFATGLFLIYQSTAWTLAYRELTGDEAAAGEAPPEAAAG